MDVHYLAEKNYFDIGHDRREESIFLNLKDLLKLAVIRDEEIRPLQTKLW
ncbi:peptidase S14, partial [Campylobacter coli]|nr:peptidase S14 [Campylobacter coli]EAK6704679.1 peptidase S14 [Campylobacter coli]